MKTATKPPPRPAPPPSLEAQRERYLLQALATREGEMVRLSGRIRELEGTRLRILDELSQLRCQRAVHAAGERIAAMGSESAQEETTR